MSVRTKQIIIRIRAIKGCGEASSNHVSTPTSEPSKPSKRSQAIWASRASNEAIQLLSQLASRSPTNQPIKKKLADQPTNQPTKEPTNEPISLLTNHGADLPNYSQNKRLRPPVPRILHHDEDDPKSCFKIVQIRICTSWDSQISQTVYLSLQLQNHMGFGFR